MSTKSVIMSFKRSFLIGWFFNLVFLFSTLAQTQVIDSLNQQLLILVEKDSARVDVLLDLSRRTFRNYPNIALQYAAEAREISKQEQYTIREAHANRYLGYGYDVQGKSDTAITFMEAALELYEKENDFRGVATINGAIGTIHAINDEFEIAILKMLGALDAYRELGNNYSIAIMYNNIGNIYFEQGIFDKAIDYYIDSIASFKQSRNQSRIILPYSGIASVFEKIGDLDQAEYYNELGIETALENNDQRSLGYMYEVAGNIELKRDAFESARSYYQEAADIFNRLQNSNKYIDVVQSIARLDYQLNDFSSARRNLEIALNAIETGAVENSRLQEHLLESFARVEQQLGNYSTGLESALMAKELADSLNEQDTAVRVAEIESNYEAEKRDNEILILTYENQAAQLKMIISIIFGVAIILVLSIFYWESSKRKALQKKLEIKSIQRELEQYGILLNEKNTYLTKVVERLNEMSSDMKTTEAKKNLYNLTDSLKQNISVSESEEVMFKKIEQVNTGFFSALRRHSEELSSSEKRLASLVQMDLSSKDIANILHINPKSVNQAKYRLKKKLNINPEIDLKEYLNTLAAK
ncbi:MAG: tetratricopeptide repeat protein [Cyanothece sp. SIO1E1]|nr:tetratricopeptide repeat protein [Cyanothece sp. SIO1E1]